MRTVTIGDRFSRLKVEKFYSKGKNNKWICRCDCGNTTVVATCDLNSENTKSCGCLARSLASSRSTVHGMYGTRPYRIWSAIKRRCQNKNYPEYHLYGGRGIELCKKWQSFSGFWEDMKNGYIDGLSIERIKNAGSYSKKNCRWATRTEQANNKRSNRIIEFNGVKMPLSSWCKKLGLPYEKTRKRLNRGWGVQESFKVL